MPERGAWAEFDPTHLGFDDEGIPIGPIVVIDLDRPEEVARWAEILDRGWTPGSRATIGTTRGFLTRAAKAIAPALTCTLAPTTAGPHPTEVSPVDDVDAGTAMILRRVSHAPRATVALDGLLRATSGLDDVGAALVTESFAYSMLLTAPEFASWRHSRRRRELPPRGNPVRLDRQDHVLRIVLDRPERRNAFATDLRAALVEGLQLAHIDPTITEVELYGRGPCFSSGGDLDEFGTAIDQASAHAVRLDQSAGFAVHRIASRVVAHLHGTCIGAGVEVPAFARRVVADEDTTFRLPELDLGLVPGAGGTVSITRRIGRWRTAYLVLSGQPISARTALEWGLVDAVE